MTVQFYTLRTTTLRFILVFPHSDWTVITHDNYLCDSARHMGPENRLLTTARCGTSNLAALAK